MNEDIRSRVHGRLAREPEKYHNAVRQIIQPRTGGISADLAAWIGSLTTEERAKITKASQELLKEASAMVSRKSYPQSLNKGVALQFRAAPSVSGSQISEIPALIGTLTRFQELKGLSDGELLRKLPILGSVTSWRRLKTWQPKNLNLAKWVQRLKEAARDLHNQPGPLTPLEEFIVLMNRLLVHAENEGLSQNRLAKKAGFKWTTWYRLRAPDAILHFHLPTWLPRLRDSVKRLGA